MSEGGTIAFAVLAIFFLILFLPFAFTMALDLVHAWGNEWRRIFGKTKR
jgi:hypothetical protein